MRSRIGNVGFLNAVPLGFGLGDDPELDLVNASPAQVADDLALGRLDVGLVPVVEAARQRLSALPDIGVVSRRAVRSVVLVTRVPLGSIRTLALDPASRTSAVLVRILLRRRHGVRPSILPSRGRGAALLEEVDAALVIGDRALTEQMPGEVHDLAAWWVAETGLPFVFAIWAARDPAHLAAVAGRLRAARAKGLANLETIAREDGPRCGVEPGVALAYLRDNLSYEVGVDERAGVSRFLAWARADGLIEPTSTIHFGT